MVNITYILELITGLFDTIYNTMTNIFGVFTTPIGTLISQNIRAGAGGGANSGVISGGNVLPETSNIFQKIIDSIGSDFLNGVFNNYTLLEFMLGAGLGLFIAFKLLGWVLDLLP